MSSLLMSKVVFSASAATALATSGYLFRDLADISQWVLDTDREDVFYTLKHRHKIAAASVASMAVNTATFVKAKPAISKYAWFAVNGTSLFLLYSGYFNPELMMRPRNFNAVYVPSSDILDLLKREESVIVTKAGDGTPRAFPDSQLLRPHVARIGETPDGVPVVMTYCGLTNLGMAFEIPLKDDGTEVELVPLTQLENNLVLMDKTTGHVGQQINGVNETALLKKIGSDSFQDTKRRPSQQVVGTLKPSEVGKEVATWRMSLGNFVRTYPNGQVFINDYKMYKSLAAPVKTIYDTLMDYIFEVSVYFQATNPKPVFPTIENIDPRLPPKEQIWAFNVGDDYVAVTEKFVRDGGDVRNITVGGIPVVASWDKETASLGIWLRPSSKPIQKPLDINGRVGGKGEPLERLATVKNGAFWCVVANFFPDIRVNPES